MRADERVSQRSRLAAERQELEFHLAITRRLRERIKRRIAARPHEAPGTAPVANQNGSHTAQHPPVET